MAPLNQALKFGLLTGLALIAYSVVLYAFDVNIFSISFSLVNLLVTFGIMIFLAVVAINKTRGELEGKITYVQALIVGFVVLIVSGYLANIFSFVLNEYIDPQYMKHQTDNMITSLEGKVPEETLEGIIEKMEEASDPIKAFVKALWMTPLFSLVVSAIVALFIKKDKTNPVE